MLERNLLSHLKLALILSLLSSSLLLRVRLVPEEDETEYEHPTVGLPVACVQFFASLAAIAAGIWEYHCGYQDLRRMHAFLVAVKCA